MLPRLRATLLAALVLPRLLRRRRRERITPQPGPNRRAETLVIVLLLASALAAAGFVVAYATDRLAHHTQLMGLALGLCFALLAAALVTIGKKLVVSEELEEDYPEPEDPDAQERLTALITESGDGFTRKRLLAGSAAAAAGALGVALLAPAVSLGPVFDTDPLYRTPWRRGVRLVDENERPWLASDIEEADFYTAYPEAVDRDQISAPVVLVRVPPAQIVLPPARRAGAPDGILAYSKICTHAGCAISLYRKPTFPDTEPKPALICPCHYSTFDPARGASVIFGPAGRPLPQLPLMIDTLGQLRAAGNFSGPVGPSWWGVRLEPPQS